MQPTPEQLEIVKNSSVHHGLDYALLCAVIEQESQWNTWAIRFEPAFYVKYIENMKDLKPTEAHSRALSWGPMQVMGQTAREMHFDGPYLSELCDFETGVEYGALKLLKCLESAANDKLKGLLAYNGGGNPAYGQQVLDRMATYQT